MENILQKKYTSFLKITLTPTLSWPVNHFGQEKAWYKSVFAKWLMVQGLVVVFGQVNYILNNRNLNFDITGQIWLGIFSSTVYFGRLIASHTKKYERLVMYFLKEFHMEHSRNKDQYFIKIYNRIEKISNYYCGFMASSLVSAILFLNAGPIIKNITNGWYFSSSPPNATFDHAIFFYPGFVHAENYPIITTMYNFYLVVTGFFAISGTDTLVVLMVFQLIGRILINLEMIRNVKISQKVPVDGDNGDSRRKSVHEQLVQIIEDHKEIVGFADMISDLFGPLIAHVYLFDLVGGCVLLLELTSSDLTFVFRFGPISLSLFGQLIQISIIFELIGHMSEKLIDAVYCMPWNEMSIPEQRVIRILLMRVQQPIQVTAIGMVPVGVKTMVSLLKASVSYYLFLNSKKQ